MTIQSNQPGASRRAAGGESASPRSADSNLERQPTELRPADFISAHAAERAELFRIWVVSYRDWLPEDWHDVPPAAIAIEPAEEGCWDARHARGYIEDFNRRILEGSQPLWAVAVPVSGRYAGDAVSGEPISGHHFAPGP